MRTSHPDSLPYFKMNSLWRWLPSVPSLPFPSSLPPSLSKQVSKPRTAALDLSETSRSDPQDLRIRASSMPAGRERRRT